MKIAIKLLFLLTLTKPGYACLPPIQAPENSAPQQSPTPDASFLLQKNVQLSTEFLILFRMGLEEKLQSLQKLSTGISALGNTTYSPELVRKQIAEYTEQIKMGMLAEHRITIRELEQAKRKTTNTRAPAITVPFVDRPDWSGPRDC